MANITSMIVGSVKHLIERAYRESGELQYLRELVINALEAGATRIEFEPEWQAVERDGVYRLMVADNGRGMSPAELLAFLNTFGGGGKPIGDAHENYGVGSKTSLLPWNQEGVVVMSWTPENPRGAMVQLRRDPETGEYGAHKFDTQDGEYTDRVEPFGIWENVKPEWIKDHGTVVVCLGNAPTEDTFVGKGGKGDLKAISTYLNKRLWAIPDGVEIYASEMRSLKKAEWPRSWKEATSVQAQKGSDRRRNRRRIEGARRFVVEATDKGSLGDSGTVSLRDGTELDWYLWNGERSHVDSYAHKSGYIAALYKNELYDTRTHVSSFRSFGIPLKDVRSRLTLIARPKLTDGKEGVYPDTARNTLKIQGTNRAGEGLPWEEWAQEFAEKLPEPIRVALAQAGASGSGTLNDPSWSKRLIDRFGSRWDSIRFVPNPSATDRIDPDINQGNRGPARGADGARSQGEGPHPSKAPGHGIPFSSIKPIAAGQVPAAQAKVRGGVPEYQWTTTDELEEGAAAWNPPSAQYLSGLVQLAADFPTIVEVRDYWVAQYPDHLADAVFEIIKQVYGEAMSARIAHSEKLVSDPRWGRTRVDTQLRSPAALTMALLGLVSEDAVISNRLSGLGVRRSAA